jgi:hypothetical protein
MASATICQKIRKIHLIVGGNLKDSFKYRGSKEFLKYFKLMVFGGEYIKGHHLWLVGKPGQAKLV